MTDFTMLRANNINRKLLASSLSSLALVFIYYSFFWQQGLEALGIWINIIFALHLVLALSRVLLWRKRFQIEKKNLVRMFPLIVTLNTLVWGVLIGVLTYHFMKIQAGPIMDIQVIHVLILIGLLLSLVQNLKYFFAIFCLNVLIVLFAVSIALIPLFQTVKGLFVCYAFLLMSVVTILVQNRRDWIYERNLSVRELEFQSLIDCFPGGVCELQGHQFRRMNKYFFEAIMQSPEGQVTGTMLKAENLKTTWQSIYFDFESGDLQHKAFEESIETFSGKRTHLFVLSRTQFQSIILVAIDIEELVEAKETALLQTKLALDKSRLATLGMMSAGIAHEISNPLALIGMIAETSAANFNNVLLNPELAKAKFQKIAVTVNRANKVMTSLKNMARSHEGSPEELVTLQEILDDALELTADRVKSSGVELHLECNCLDLLIHCRPTEICQVLINAINNSVHAVEGQNDRWIQLKIYLTSENLLQLEIVDSGKGIPEAVRGRIAEPLFTTKSYGKGTGLGLSLSNEIMKNHGGQLFFDFQRSNTTLVLQLPLKFC